MRRCIICNQPIQGRKRRDARVCAGECAKKLALARTKAWKSKQPFSVRRGVVPGLEKEVV
jgi:hypothetical protein